MRSSLHGEICESGGVIVPRITAGKRSELESFWRAHLDGWRRSDLNQREYCELHGLADARLSRLDGSRQRIFGLLVVELFHF